MSGTARLATIHLTSRDHFGCPPGNWAMFLAARSQVSASGVGLIAERSELMWKT